MTQQRDPRSERQAAPPLPSRAPAAPAFDFTDAQRRQRTQQQAAMRAGLLRGLPTVFGGL